MVVADSNDQTVQVQVPGSVWVVELEMADLHIQPLAVGEMGMLRVLAVAVLLGGVYRPIHLILRHCHPEVDLLA